MPVIFYHARIIHVVGLTPRAAAHPDGHKVSCLWVLAKIIVTQLVSRYLLVIPNMCMTPLIILHLGVNRLTEVN